MTPSVSALSAQLPRLTRFTPAQPAFGRLVFDRAFLNTHNLPTEQVALARLLGRFPDMDPQADTSNRVNSMQRLLIQQLDRAHMHLRFEGQGQTELKAQVREQVANGETMFLDDIANQNEPEILVEQQQLFADSGGTQPLYGQQTTAFGGNFDVWLDEAISQGVSHLLEQQNQDHPWDDHTPNHLRHELVQYDILQLPDRGKRLTQEAIGNAIGEPLAERLASVKASGFNMQLLEGTTPGGDAITLSGNGLNETFPRSALSLDRFLDAVVLRALRHQIDHRPDIQVLNPETDTKSWDALVDIMA
ncbi:MAG: hypothetical protein R2857_15570 [Vampirovibrionales bacterium]